MRFASIVVLFVVAVAVFTLLAGLGYRSSLENELRQISMSELERAGFDGVDVGFDHLQARVSGEVESEEEKATVLELLSSKVTTGHFPSIAEADLEIRPTLHPEIHVSRTVGGNEVLVSGVLANSDEAALALIAGRLNSLEAIETINNSIELDPRRFTFPGVTELASLASQLIENSYEAEVHMAGDVLTINGEVGNDGLKASLLDLAGRVGVGEVVDNIKVAEPVSLRVPSTLKMTRNRFGVIVSGKVGSEESKNALVKIFSGMDSPVHLTDRLEVSRLYSPALWEDFASGILPILLEKFSGELTADFTEETVRLSGRVDDEAGRDAVIAVFQDLNTRQPSLELLTEIEILGAPTKETASVEVLVSYNGELLNLDGIVPGVAFVEALEALEARLRSRFPHISVKSDLTESGGAVEAPWLERLPEFFEELISRTEVAKLEYEGETLLLEGTVKAQSDKQILQNIAINSLPEGTVIENKLISSEDPLSQLSLVRAQITESLKALPVYFDSGSETVKASESEKVDSIVQVITKTGGTPPLLVTGFADNVGNAAYNRALSLRRANEVVQRLEAGGIPKESISVETKGEDISNVTRSERWKSRRVEVSLKPLETAPEEEGESEPNP